VRAPGRLRVAVPRALLALPREGGHGKVWRSALHYLAERVRVGPLEPTGGPAVRAAARRPDVVLADGPTSPPRGRVPLVAQIHEAGWFEPELRSTLEPAFYEFLSARVEAAVHAAEQVLTLSESSRRDLIANYGLEPARVHAAYPGVDSVFGPAARGGRELVSRLRGGRAAPYVLFASALHPRKNLPALREAMSMLAREGCPHVLVVAGGPASDRPDSSELERTASAELAGAPGRVVRVPRPDDRTLAALMAEADAFCLPSLYEGFGVTVLEAMACGAPTVVSDRGALPEVVGNTGLVTTPTAEGIAAALRRVLGERETAERLGRAAAARAREFTWERSGERWLAVLRLAAGRG